MLVRSAAILVFVALAAVAEQPAGEIRIQVQDPSGAPMRAAAKVEGPRVTRTLRSDPSGLLVVDRLPYGRYRVDLSHEGFTSSPLFVDVQSPEPVSITAMMAVAQAPRAAVDVVDVTPLPGTDLELNQFPHPVQTASQADIDRSGALDLEDFLNRRMNGVHLNEMQGNPFQPDVNFRGYTASPVLGTPQGLSVYMDGVRQNQPFGDVVSWDLIPRNTIESVTLMSGSDPLFGLNALGGAISIQTKDGVSHPGTSGAILYGASGRKALQVEHGGGAAPGWNWFLAANIFHESGWRFDSPSDIRQGFAKIGWRGLKTDLFLSAAYAYNTLTGNGLQDYRLLARDYRSAYTVPDTTGNRSPAVHLAARQNVSARLALSGGVYYRNVRSEGISGNLNANSLDQSVYQPNGEERAALSAAGYSGFPVSGANASNTPFPKWRCIAQGLLQDEPVEKCNGLIAYSRDIQHSYGASGQLTWLTDTRAGRNQLTVGAAMDHAVVRFTQNTQFGYLNPDRSITGINAWEDGTTNSNGTPVDTRVNLRGLTPAAGVYFTDTLSINKAWNLTVSGRFNHNRIDNTDRLAPPAGPGSLTGNYVFERFNPAAGITYSPVASLNLYASYTEGSRAPTSIELGCADPANPCSLPNALASDPPLRQVITGTWEAGVRGRWEPGLRWNLGGFRALNRDDLLFVASPQNGSGYFKNFARTLRQGVQASLGARVGRLSGGLDYTYLAATYESSETLNGNANSSSDLALAGTPGVGGVITVHPGNRIPLVPKQSGKAYADLQATSKLLIDADLIAVSSSYARGNENNGYQADGKYYLGPGVSGGYAVVNLAARYSLTKRLELRGQVDNLLDRRYATAAQLATTGFTSQGAFVARAFPAYTSGQQAGNYPIPGAVFFAPGAPRRMWVELRLKF